MALEWEIDEERRRLSIVLRDALTADDVLSMRRVLEHPALKSSFDTLVDASEVRSVEVGASAVRHFATFYAGRHFGRMAVVTENAALFGMTRMYALLTNREAHIRPCRSLRDARAFIDHANAA